MPQICISAGHSPDKPGAHFGNFYEHEEAVEWAEVLALNTLTPLEPIIVPTGTLQEKVSFINDIHPDIAIEIHFNSAVSTTGEHIGKGSESLYYPGSEAGEAAAETIQRHLSSIFPPDRGAKEGWYQMNPSKGSDYFLKKTSCTSVIIEPEFIHRKSIIQNKRLEGCLAILSAIEEILYV